VEKKKTSQKVNMLQVEVRGKSVSMSMPRNDPLSMEDSFYNSQCMPETTGNNTPYHVMPFQS
jgi:hypothetical protein